MGILRSVNNLGKNDDIERTDNQSIMKTEGLFIFEEEYISGILDLDILALAVFSVSTFSNSSILKILWEIVRINFLYYIFFYFQR